MAKLDEPISLEKRRRKVCFHGRFTIDDELNTVECGKCGELLNPMYVLSRLASEETRLSMRIAKNKCLIDQIEKKKRTKCDHCGRFTTVKTARVKTYEPVEGE